MLYKSNILLTDTTLILNKLGVDNTGYNPQIPKHNLALCAMHGMRSIPRCSKIFQYY